MSLSGRDLQLIVPAEPQNVALARQAVTGLAEAIGIESRLLEDVRLAVTEACTNAVVHAYATPVTERPMVVAAAASAEQLVISVRDEGRGMGTFTGNAGLGLGLPLVAALAQRMEVQAGRDGRGTEVVMTFDIAPARGGAV